MGTRRNKSVRLLLHSMSLPAAFLFFRPRKTKQPYNNNSTGLIARALMSPSRLTLIASVGAAFTIEPPVLALFPHLHRKKGGKKRVFVFLNMHGHTHTLLRQCRPKSARHGNRFLLLVVWQLLHPRGHVAAALLWRRRRRRRRDLRGGGRRGGRRGSWLAGGGGEGGAGVC